MGRLDAIDIGPRKLTIQTEHFPRPTSRIETKVYLGGALKKIFTEEIAADDPDLQKILNRIHETRMNEIVSGLRGLQPQ